MKKQYYYSILIIFGSLFCLFLNATSISHQKGYGFDDEVEDQVEFDYKEGSKKGPSKWGELHKEWKTCKNGKMQSPIDISSCRVKIMRKKLGHHKKYYKPSNSTIRNRGHDISLHWHGDAGSILMNGTHYPLLQIHWHSPSEHTINGKRYALELHMVHHSTDEKVKNKIVVNAVLYKFGRPDPFLFILRRHILSMIDQEGEERNLGMINPSYIINNIHRKSYYKYKGSLTIPPCTEGVTWIINKKVQTVSKSQVMLLKQAVHDYAESNARPLQPHNKRKIHLYSPITKTCQCSYQF